MRGKDQSTTSCSATILAECIGEELPPCQAACPLDIRVREQIRFMQEGKMAEALAVVLERCPFPGILGRICPHPCETACTRAGLDQPLAIAALKRHLADLEPPPVNIMVPGETRSQPVAVVGGGPAGLMAAVESRRLGYPVTLFEAEASLGGALNLYIPSYRLPRAVLEREVSLVSRLGVELRLRTRLGRDAHLEDLRRNFAAVFLALGAHKSLRLQIPGEDLDGVTDALTFLKDFNLDVRPVVGERVAVIGGGNAALDAARSAWRAGAREVHLLYRRTKELMPALVSEVAEAHREGIKFHFLTLPVRLLGEGQVTGLLAQKTELREAGSDGRHCAVPVAGTDFALEVDTVITAVGQTADFGFFGPGLAFDTATIFKLKADPRILQTQIPGVFAGGDLVTGRLNVVAAFAAGRRAALAMHAFIQQEPLPANLPPLATRRTELVVNTRGVAPADRHSMPSLSLKARRDRPPAEVELGFDAVAAAREANRCLTCVCSECVKNCTFLQHYVQKFPPTEKELVHLLAGKGQEDLLIPYSCHYCGLCQAVCPKDLHAGQPCLEIRQTLVAQGEGPLPPHKGIQDYVRWGSSPTFTLTRPDPGTGRVRRVFFPGCSLAGHHTAVVKAVYHYLRQHLSHTGILLNCCGAPSYFLGEKETMLAITRNLAAEMAHLKAEEFIVACPHCLMIFREFLPQFSCRTVYEVLNEVGPPPPSRRTTIFNVQDACGARKNPEVHEAVRQLVANLGHGIEEMAHTRERSICCGSGGMVPAVAPELAKKMTDFRLSEATRDLVTYCASCRARFAKAAYPSLHVLDLAFNPHWPRTKNAPPPHSLRRWWRRWWLKRHLGEI